MDNRRYGVSRTVGRCGGALDASQCAVQKELARSRDQRRKRAICVIRQKAARIDDPTGTANVVLANDFVEYIGATHPDTT